MKKNSLARVDYQSLDKAKNAFIEASKKTLNFAKKYGFVVSPKLGASSNVFALDLKSFKGAAPKLYLTLVPEGLGTADDARPDDLSSKELRSFWRNIGIKTVAVMTNDAAASGMQSILISLYLPSSRPDKVFTPEFMDGFLSGFVEACRQVGCVYFSGETPQLETKIYPEAMDIAGATFGIMPAGFEPISSDALNAGDYIVFIESSGPHENGFTTLRDLASKLPKGYRTKLPSGQQYWQACNAPSKLYTPLVQDILRAGIRPTNIEPISGHGWQKLMRSSKSFAYIIEKILPVPEIFKYVEEKSGMSKKEMISTFNYGVGYAIFTRTLSDANKVCALAKKHSLGSCVAGYVKKDTRRHVFVKPFNIELLGSGFTLSK